MSDQAKVLRQLAKNTRHSVRYNLPHFPRCRVVAITSGKGGVGKTNLTINLALALKEQGKQVLILDADLGLANVDVLMGIIPSLTLSQVMKGEKNLRDVIVYEHGIGLIAGSSGVEEFLNLQKWQLENFLRELQQLDGMGDFIFIDTGAGISHQVLGFVLAATDIILVTTPEPSAITDAYALLKVIASKNKEAVVRLVVNRALNPQEAKQVLKKLRLVTKKFLALELLDLGHIVEDPRIPRAVKAQEPFLYVYPHSPASLCVHKVADKLLSTYGNDITPPSGNLKGLFQRLFSLFH